MTFLFLLVFLCIALELKSFIFVRSFELAKLIALDAQSALNNNEMGRATLQRNLRARPLAKRTVYKAKRGTREERIEAALGRVALATIAVGIKAKKFMHTQLQSLQRNANFTAPLYVVTDDIVKKGEIFVLRN